MPKVQKNNSRCITEKMEITECERVIAFKRKKTIVRQEWGKTAWS